MEGLLSELGEDQIQLLQPAVVTNPFTSLPIPQQVHYLIRQTIAVGTHLPYATCPLHLPGTPDLVYVITISTIYQIKGTLANITVTNVATAFLFLAREITRQNQN